MAIRKKILLLGDVNSIHLQKWAIGLKDDFDISIISLDPLEKENDALLEIQVFSNEQKTVNSRSKISYLQSIFQFRKIHKQINPDFVHAHYSSSYGLIGALLRPKTYFISVWGEDVYEFPNRSSLHKWVYKWIIKKATKLFSTSENMKVELEKYTSKQIHVIPFGIDLSLFNEKDHAIQNQTFTIGTVKALEHIYGVDNLIKAFHIFHQKVPESKCVIYGKGTAEENLKKIAKNLGLEKKVEFKGFVLNSFVPQAIQAIDIFCVLSRQESFGVAAVEASSCGVPVIAANVGGLPEVIIDKVTGFIVEEDIEAIAAKMFDLYADDDLRKKMGKKGREFVTDQYNWSNNLESMQQFYI